MVKATVESDASKKFSNVLAYYTKVMGKGANEVLKQQATLLVKECVRVTLPFGSGLDARRVGENAVEKNIKKAVKPIDDLKIFKNTKLQNKIKKYVDQGNFADAEAIFQNIPTLATTQIVPFSPNLHTSVRDKGDNLKVKQQHKLTPDSQSWVKYLKDVKSKVGKLKASWLPAAEKLGLKLPRWIEKHKDSAYKHTIVEFHEGDKPFIQIENTTPSIGRMASVIEQSMVNRARNMVLQMRRFIKSQTQGAK